MAVVVFHLQGRDSAASLVQMALWEGTTTTTEGMAGAHGSVSAVSGVVVPPDGHPATPFGRSAHRGTDAQRRIPWPRQRRVPRE